MRAPILVAGLAVALGGVRVAPASAQSPAAWTDRGRVSINFGVQPASGSFTTTATKPIYVENAVFTGSYSGSSGPMFDVGVAVRIKKNFGVGVAVSSFSGKHDGDVTGTVPHPFFFNTPRSINGTAPGLERSELATHIQAVYVMPRGKFDVAIEGGPSLFNAKQDLVTDVVYAETYPYDVATFTSATTSRVSKTQIGFNVSVDVGVRLSRNVGVGGLVRFARATADLSASNGVSAKVDVGGVQAGGGLRVYF